MEKLKSIIRMMASGRMLEKFVLLFFYMNFSSLRKIHTYFMEYKSLDKEVRATYKHPKFRGDRGLYVCWGLMVLSIDNPFLFVTGPFFGLLLIISLIKGLI